MNSTLPSGRRLAHLLENAEPVVAPGIYDHISLRLASEAGFQALYASGYWNAASSLGEPDVGIAGARDFVEIFARFSAKSSLPVIADADTGFGSLINLDRAARAYARAGIAAMQIEDQTFPKICGHAGRAQSAKTSEMLARIAVACEARSTSEMLIIARTDARRSEGLNAAIDRLSAYAEAGADVLFLEAPESDDEIALAAEALTKPLMINAAHGGVTPVRDPAHYGKLGVSLIIYPAGAPLSAAAAAQRFYRDLAHGNANPEQAGMFDFDTMSGLLGMNDVVALQQRHELP